LPVLAGFRTAVLVAAEFGTAGSVRHLKINPEIQVNFHNQS